MTDHRPGLRRLAEALGGALTDTDGESVPLEPKQDLSNRVLADLQFVDVDFRDVLLGNTDFENCTFEGCVFDDAKIHGTSFTDCELHGCSFDRSVISDFGLTRCQFLSCSMRSATLEVGSINDTTFCLFRTISTPDVIEYDPADQSEPVSDVELVDRASTLQAGDSRWYGVQITGSTLDGADLKRSHFVDVDFRDSSLLAADLSDAALIDCDLSRAVLLDPHVFLRWFPQFGGGGAWEEALDWSDLRDEHGGNLDAVGFQALGLRHNSDEMSEDSCGTMWPHLFEPGPANASRDDFRWWDTDEP